MDLSLYLVEKFCGHEVALQCAKALLINMARPSQSGYATLPLSRPHNDEKVRAAESLLEQNYAEDVSLELLAQDLGMSPRNFSRRFKRATGRLSGNYLQAMRVAIAKEMLEGGARSVQVISAAVGYEDAAFFRGLFKRATGMTPGEYRENFAGSNGARFPVAASTGRGARGTPTSGATPGPPPASSCRAAAPGARAASRPRSWSRFRRTASARRRRY
jgi:transcriptional regulator GlxA family with amidase domain